MAITPKEKNEITQEVLVAIDHYTDEPIDVNTTYADTGTIELTKHLGIGPVMIAQLSIPFTKISVKHGGRGVGVYAVQKAKTVKDCIDLVIKSV